MGEVVSGDTPLPAAKALKQAELSPIRLEPPERSALLSGSALSTASALAGLFEAERLFRSALVATALSAAAMRGPGAPLHPRALELHRQPGADRGGGGPPGARQPPTTPTREPSDAEESAMRAAPLQLGACLDLLRQAGATLERAANAVTETRLIVWQSGEIDRRRRDDRSSVAGATDLIALALLRIAELSQARIAALCTGDAKDGEAAHDEPRRARRRLPDAHSCARRAERRGAAAAGDVGHGRAGAGDRMPGSGAGL